MQIDSALSTTIPALVIRPDRDCDVWVWRDWVYILVDHFGDSSPGVQGLDEEENEITMRIMGFFYAVLKDFVRARLLTMTLIW